MKSQDVKRFVPLALTIGSCLGVGAVAILSAHDTVKAMDILKDVDGPEEATLKAKAKWAIYNTWKCYIPTAVVGVGTVVTILFNHQLTKKEIAAIAAAAVGSGKLLDQYQAKIREKFGDEAIIDIRESIARDHADGIPVAAVPPISFESMCSIGVEPIVDAADTLFYDELYDVWFYSNLYSVKNAMYHLNRNMAIGQIAIVADFYEFLGVAAPDNTYNVGWGEDFWCDGLCWIDFELTEADFGEEKGKGYVLHYSYTPEPLEEITPAVGGPGTLYSAAE